MLKMRSRKRLEEAVPETDCGGRKYADWEREDIIRYMLLATEIQRDYDEVQLLSWLCGIRNAKALDILAHSIDR